MTTRLLHNPLVRAARSVPPDHAPYEFHRRFPGYTPSPLTEMSALAAALGVGRLWVKDESSRFGLPSFKILGASWATYRTLTDRLAMPGASLDALRAALTGRPPMTLATATDGNHGRAVARMATLLGCRAHVLVPAGTVHERIRAIAGEGAVVTIVDGTYDQAVAQAATEAGPDCLVISDTSWPGYEDVPRWITEGYGTIFTEADVQLGNQRPDLVVVQIGVGSLATAVVRHYRPIGARIVGIEPTSAACMLASVEAGRIVAVPGPHTSIMAGLNCGVPSLRAWPVVSTGVDLFVAIEDERAREGMRRMAEAGIVAGETGAAGVGGLLELLAGPDAARVRDLLAIDQSTRVLCLSTEGATDPVAYGHIVGLARERN
ncbi:MAG: diaminopropionate ammonia-lyase [Thermomicrobiales bacterium]